MKETDLKKKVRTFLTDKGWFIKYYSGKGMGQAGVPDFIGCMEGRFVSIELKTETGKLSRLQEHTINEIKKQNGISVVVYGWEDFQIKFQKIKEAVLCQGGKEKKKSQ